MKKFLLLALVCTIGFSYSSKASSIYQVDDAAIEATLNMATAVNIQIPGDLSSLLNPAVMAASKSDKSFVTALLLSIFLGDLGIHRVYLGSKGIMIFYYIITGCGIFGVVPFIDFILIIVNHDNLGQYNNNRYFMWTGK